MEEWEKEMSLDDDLLNKDITNVDKVEPVAKALGDMGKLWKEITQKLAKDAQCYICKRDITDKEEFQIISVPSNKVDRGLVVFASVCPQCNIDTDEV